MKKVSSMTLEIFPHVYLQTASWDAIEKGEKLVEGSTYSFLTSIVFTAFALEAYINEMIKEKFPDTWENLERKSSHEKLSKLCKLESFELNYREKPFSIFQEIRDFRNSIAHSKPERYNGNVEFNERGIPILPDWSLLEKCTSETAIRYYDETEKLIKLLQKELNIKTISLISPVRSSAWRV